MQKREKSKSSHLDREEISKLIKSVESAADFDDDVKAQLVKYLSLVVNLSMDVEHSKITLSKLQKLFGFYSDKARPKEV